MLLNKGVYLAHRMNKSIRVWGETSRIHFYKHTWQNTHFSHITECPEVMFEAIG